MVAVQAETEEQAREAGLRRLLKSYNARLTLFHIEVEVNGKTNRNV